MAASSFTAPGWPVAAAVGLAVAAAAGVGLALGGPDAARLPAAVAGYAVGLLLGVLLWTVERKWESRRRDDGAYRFNPGRDTALRVLLVVAMLSGLACAVLAALEIAKR